MENFLPNLQFFLHLEDALNSVCSKANSERNQTSKIEIFLEILNSWKLLTAFVQSSILDVSVGFEYTLYCMVSSTPKL